MRICEIHVIFMRARNIVPRIYKNWSLKGERGMPKVQ